MHLFSKCPSSSVVIFTLLDLRNKRIKWHNVVLWSLTLEESSPSRGCQGDSQTTLSYPSNDPPPRIYVRSSWQPLDQISGRRDAKISAADEKVWPTTFVLLNFIKSIFLIQFLGCVGDMSSSLEEDGTHSPTLDLVIQVGKLPFLYSLFHYWIAEVCKLYSFVKRVHTPGNYLFIYFAL